MRAITLLLMLAALLGGCTRSHYRNSADRETYPIIAERVTSPAFDIGRIQLDPAPNSRLADPTNPDRPPKPPDDPAASIYMARPNGMHGSKRWGKDGHWPLIEMSDWESSLPRDADGKVKLDAGQAADVALLNSREYQTALEQVYLVALSLTLNRFEFATRWFLTQATTYSHFGASSTPTESNTLTASQRLGFNKAFAAGGQLLVDFANTFVIEFTGRNRTVMNSNLVINFLQPLLRGGGRAVRLEDLTQAERDVLYAVRDFARFRKQFWADVTTGRDGYLDLLQQMQNIRSFQANLSSQEQNLRLHEELFRGGKVSVVQVDQAFQSYQQARVSIAQAEAGLQTSLDTFKLTLGLPPRLPIELDDSLLSQFQLTDPPLEKLRDEIEAFQRERFREIDALPPLSALRDDYNRLRHLAARSVNLIPPVAADLKRWGEIVEQPAAEGSDPGQRERMKAAYADIASQFPQLKEDLPKLVVQIDADIAGLKEATRKVDWEALLLRTRRALTLTDQLVSVQTQSRINRIELPTLEWDEPRALAFAHENRLDLMNRQAIVTDTWRKVTVTANGLRAGLNIVAGANIAADPTSLNPFDFSAQASRYNIGFEFDGPLNRQAERNTYRVSLINYQRARRAYMELSDTIEQQIRVDLRSLALTRLTFEAARQTLLSAARQVEAARVRILDQRDAAGTSSTLDILNALNSLLQARINLVSSYISYSQQRVRLMVDLEALQLDSRGRPTDDLLTPAPDASTRNADPTKQRAPEQLPPPRSVDDPAGARKGAPAKLAGVVRPSRRRSTGHRGGRGRHIAAAIGQHGA